MSVRDQNLIVAVDFGSNHACARVYNHYFKCLSESILPSKTLDPEVCWHVLCELLDVVVNGSNISRSSICCLGLSLQRNTFLLWNRQTSAPITQLCTWQDTDASTFANTRNNSIFVQALNRSGRLLNKVFPSTKFKLASQYKLTCLFAITRLAHMFDEDPTLYEKCRGGEIVFGCLETWLLWRLTGGRAWCTDVSCCSTSGAFDPCVLGLSPLILGFLNISPKILPPICPTSTFYGEVRFGPLARSLEELSVGYRRVRVTALIGDSQAAMLGEGCLNVGDTKLTLGTGAFLSVNIGSKTVSPHPGFYPVIGWTQSVRSSTDTSCEDAADTVLKNVTFLLEGFNTEAGNTLLKLKVAGFFQSYSELEDILSSASSGNPTKAASFFLPSSLGLRRSLAKWQTTTTRCSNEQMLAFVNTDRILTEGGVFVGLPSGGSGATSQTHRAALFALMDSIVMAARLLIGGVNKQLTSKMSVLRVNGNLTRSDWLLQRLADTLNLSVERSVHSETCCLGAAIAAGVGAKLWDSYSDAVSAARGNCTPFKGEDSATISTSPNSANPKTRFTPDPSASRRMDARYARWIATCIRVLSVTNHEAGFSINDHIDSVPLITLNSLLNSFI